MKQTEKMKIINPHAAGIDIGSKSHFVAIGQQNNQVKEFNVYSSGQKQIISYLKENGIKTIAMESTGSYWQSLFRVLQEEGFEVLLVSGAQTKNVRGKTDVKDCQWIQKLHSLGLLSGCYLPSELTQRIRTLSRHRQSLVEASSSFSNKMQKSLRLMNLRLDVVLNDIMGVSGKKIIEAILNGERNGKILSQLADSRVRKSKTEIADALQGQWNDELLYELKSCYQLYKTLQKSIADCDLEIEKILEKATAKVIINPSVKLKKKQRKGKNQPRFNLSEYSYKLYGVDLFAIESVSMNTVMTFIAEIGSDIFKFNTSKHFTSWLRLAPNNKISGGKLISSRTPKGRNKFALALRNAANTIDKQKSGTLYSFFKRVAYKKGRAAAITATARKLAVIIWNMVVKKQEYKPIEETIYIEEIKRKKLISIKKIMQNYGISTTELSAT
jgi:transposase